MDGKVNRQRQDIFARPVRAGRRTYFFDVKQTRKGDLFLTITESKRVLHKKKNDNEKGFHYEKHKIFLYKEDFEKFHEAFKEVVDFVWDNVDESLEQGGLQPDDFEDDQNQNENAKSDDSTDNEFSSSDHSDSQGEAVNADQQTGSEDDESEDKSASAFTDVSFEDLDENGVPHHSEGQDDETDTSASKGQ